MASSPGELNVIIAIAGTHTVTDFTSLKPNSVGKSDLEALLKIKALARDPPKKCTGFKVDSFVLINCEDQGGVSWIFEKDQILARGYGDSYSSGQSRIIVSFKLNGELAYLVYVDKKTHGAPGILVKRKGEWKFYHAVDNFAHMC